MKRYEIESEIKPICPYCIAEVNIEDWLTAAKSVIQKVSKLKYFGTIYHYKTTIFFCPHCRKILGVSKERI